MLVLSRKIGETIVINKQIYITILKDENGKTEIGIDAPKQMPVERLEIMMKKNNKN